MQRRNAQRRILALVAAGVFLVVAHLIGILSPVESLIAAVSRPAMEHLSGTGSAVNNVWEVVTTAGELGSENRRLRAEVASLRQQVSHTTEVKAQNDALRQQLGVGSVRADRLIAAEVIGYQPDNFHSYITIGRGSRDGIKPGMVVIEQGALIGTIKDVGTTTSKVFLMIDPDFRVDAIDQDAPNRPNGTIHGQIGSGLTMEKIAQNETIRPGDTIVTSGLGTNIQKGLIIGRVQTVTRQDNGVFQTAQVTTDVQFNRLEVVYVIARPE